MKVLLDIKDEKAEFILEMLRNFKYVKAKPLLTEKEKQIRDIKEAIEEIKLIRAGKKQAKNAEDFLNEL